MEATIKRGLGKAVACEDAKGEYCYCRCLGVFHGINHQPIRDREAQLRARKEPLDVCTCEEPNIDSLHDMVWYHQKTDSYFQVCRSCGGRKFTGKDYISELDLLIRNVTSGIRVK